eukprot:scaffold2874_cov110-Alexandrium_tamarense.AAC.23
MDATDILVAEICFQIKSSKRTTANDLSIDVYEKDTAESIFCWLAVECVFAPHASFLFEWLSLKKRIEAPNRWTEGWIGGGGEGKDSELSLGGVLY